MAKSRTRQYELRAPGIGFHPTRHGTLCFKYTSANILKLRDALVEMATKLTDEAVGMIERERELELQQMQPPPSMEARFEQRVTRARKMPKFTPIVSRQIRDSIERAKGASSRKANLPDLVAEVQPPALPAERTQPRVKVAIPLPAQDNEPVETQVTHEEKPSTKVIVSGGFDNSDDGSLGEPPATIR